MSSAGITSTVFGSTGFIARYIVQRLARIGAECVVPYRGDGMNTRHLKPMGDLGKVTPLPVDFSDIDTLRKTVIRSNVIINCIGNQHTTVNYTYDDTHVKCVHRICKVAAETGQVKRFIHFSALGADINSPSAFLRSKAHGEQVVRDFFPQAIILRPSSVYGEEDKFLNRQADIINWMPFVPIVGQGQQMIQPVSVHDVAMAVLAAVVDSNAPGRIFELGGPDVMTRRDLVNWVAAEIKNGPTVVLPLPQKICRLYAQVLAKVFPISWRMLSPDHVDQMSHDQLVSQEAMEGTHNMGTFDHLGITPVSMTLEGRGVLLRHIGQRQGGTSFELPKGDPRRAWIRQAW